VSDPAEHSAAFKLNDRCAEHTSKAKKPIQSKPVAGSIKVEDLAHPVDPNVRPVDS
jgi:hypothetical protein